MKLFFLSLPFILIISIFFSGCSDRDEKNNAKEDYIPYPPKPVPTLSVKEQKKISLKFFSRIEPGEFLMGSPSGEQGRRSDEKIHRVKITRPYYISKFEVTVKEWNAVLGDFAKKEIKFLVPEKQAEFLGWFYNERESDPFKKLINSNITNTEKLENFFSEYKKFIDRTNGELVMTTAELGSVLSVLANLKPAQKVIENHSPEEVASKINSLRSLWSYNMNMPVTDISYSQVLQYCYSKTTEAHKNGDLPKGLVFRLPSEAEWEYACRAGNSGVCGLDEGKNLSGMNANINGGAHQNIIGKPELLINRNKLTPISRTNPRLAGNAWGLHDMHGNVMEWCYDFYGEYPDQEAPISIDPIGPIRGAKRVLRGGSFLRPAQSARSASRESLEPSWRGSEIGFRLVLGYPFR